MKSPTSPAAHPRRWTRVLTASVTLALGGFGAALALAHGGGLDRCGGHREGNGRGYHVHNQTACCACHPGGAGCERRQGSDPNSAIAAQEERQDRLLRRLDKVTELYRDTALRFSCRERITYHPGSPYMRVYDLDYMYVFDKQSGLRDYRTEIRTGRKKDKPARPVTLSDLNLTAVVLRAYSAVFVFQGSKRDNYRYSIIRDERALGRDAVVIRFEAIPPYKTDYNDWFGSAWVDLETSQLLKVEAMKADQHEEKLRLESDLAGRSSGSDRPAEGYIIENVLTEFSVEHNGMRFPSRVVIRRSRFEISERKGGRTPKEH